MIVTCGMCHCSITLNAFEGPLRVCPMCGHNFACTWVMSDTSGIPREDYDNDR